MRFAHLNILIVILFTLKITHIHAVGNMYTSAALNKYFINFDETFTWFESQIACAEMNMTLLEVDTSAKSLEVNTLIQDVRQKNNVGERYIWSGGILNRFPKHHFVWLSSGEKASFTNWKSGEPNFLKDNEFCLSLYTSVELLWNDDPCSRPRGYICEYSEKQKELQNFHEKLEELREKLNKGLHNHE
ncbi:C-type lectin 1-like [Cochliomyia hominivorax]